MSQIRTSIGRGRRARIVWFALSCAAVLVVGVNRAESDTPPEPASTQPGDLRDDPHDWRGVAQQNETESLRVPSQHTLRPASSNARTCASLKASLDVLETGVWYHQSMLAEVTAAREWLVLVAAHDRTLAAWATEQLRSVLAEMVRLVLELQSLSEQIEATERALASARCGV